MIDPFLAKLEELVERSHGKIRADVAHDKITAMGYAGSERTTRRAVAELKANRAAGRRRVHRPWIPEPGMWAQYDFGDGPRIGGTATILFCLWLAWSRFRVVLPLLDKSQPSVLAAVDVALRRIGGVPTYLLTDNEKTVTVEHVAGIPVRNPAAVAFARALRADDRDVRARGPADQGRLRGDGPDREGRPGAHRRRTCCPTTPSFAELEQACEAFCGEVNARPHRATRRPPADMLAEERARLHPVPAAPFTAALGVTRKVDGLSLVSFEGGRYSVPHQLAGQAVWVRRHGDDIVIVHAGAGRPGRGRPPPGHQPGQPQRPRRPLPAAPAGPAGAGPRARTAAEAEFLAIGDGAGLWLAEAAAAGASRVRAKMAEAVQLARLHRPPTWTGRWGRPPRPAGSATATWPRSWPTRPPPRPATATRASEDHTLAQGTGRWAALGGGEVTR